MPNPHQARPDLTTPARESPTDPYDALLLVSFGGPERPEDVVPFLENVTRGRGIPRERLEAVGEHYFLFGGRSPINDQNKALIAAVEKDLADHGLDLPVYWGNRNWAPYLADTVARMAADGVRRALCLVTSAYSSWSSCRQYLVNLEEASAAVPEGLVAPRLDKIRAYYNHPGFVTANVEGVLGALADLPDELRDQARLVFVTHSIPMTMSDSSGPPRDRAEGGAYVAQHRDVAAVVAAEVAAVTGIDRPHELVYCSRSGAPHVPWLEPDVNDRLEELAAEGTGAVVLIPVGFVSDHMEVVYDLDTEALATAARLGLAARRASSAGTHPAFVSAVRELVLERAAAERGADTARPALGGRRPSHDSCPLDCCLGPRA
ncbi:ferrochelatase [Nocardioides carbamazepini]|uniref:ferrochelatase n=1 Tax=Nocardioides carbamazepini TaxID=2854259 RepID=UPI00214A63EA|nr:ferrochelatase [Nocardioides carbamazepini]MCR1781521.1 ferrochelatase [Nocardioides carbamazepini]